MDKETAEELKSFIAQQVGMVSSEVRELREDIEARFDVVDKQIREARTDVKDMHAKFSELQSSVDHYFVRAELVAQEQLVMKHQMDRYDRWFKLLGDKVGLDLEHAA